jgi:hypothetical protein
MKSMKTMKKLKKKPCKVHDFDIFSLADGNEPCLRCGVLLKDIWNVYPSVPRQHVHVKSRK